jgi:hypothetical protein
MYNTRCVTCNEVLSVPLNWTHFSSPEGTFSHTSRYPSRHQTPPFTCPFKNPPRTISPESSRFECNCDREKRKLLRTSSLPSEGQLTLHFRNVITNTSCQSAHIRTVHQLLSLYVYTDSTTQIITINRPIFTGCNISY